MKKVYSILILGFLFFAGMLAQTQETDVTPIKDNSIFEEGDLSNGAGQHLFTGVTNLDKKRRALIKFDLEESLPEGVLVDSAFLIITPTLVKTAGTTVTLYRMNSFWGEGSSDAEGQEGKGAPASEGDATWTKSVANGDAWVKPGGDYDLQPLASSTVSLENKPQFGSSLLTVLVNAWIADPSTNHGVIVIGDERAKATAIRFSSRENGDFESWPTLKLYYQGATSAFNKEINAHNLQVYPDHSSTDLMIRNSDGPVNSRIELYSITGALLYSSQQHLAEGENRINTDIEGSGVYLYRVISSTGVVSGKFLIQSR